MRVVPAPRVCSADAQKKCRLLPKGTKVRLSRGVNSIKTTVAGTLIYGVQLDSTNTTLAAGTYNFTGVGGPDVGPFTASYTFPTPFSWTNQSSLATIVRANGATINWTGGDPAGYVTIAGDSTLAGATAATTATVSFTCTARVTDGTFTGPPVVLLALPPTAAAPGATFATPGTLSVTHIGTTVTQIKATGIEIGGIGSVFAFGTSATYQ